MPILASFPKKTKIGAYYLDTENLNDLKIENRYQKRLEKALPNHHSLDVNAFRNAMGSALQEAGTDTCVMIQSIIRKHWILETTM